MRLSFTDEELDVIVESMGRLPDEALEELLCELEVDPWLLTIWKPYLLGESTVQ